MSAALDALLRTLDLQEVQGDVFRGHSPADSLPRVFGGQVAGQALVAAGRTVSAQRPVHSLHAYFLRPGDPSVPILYEVDRIRDGRSFTTRRVVALQHGQAIFNLAASFHVTEPGAEHQRAMPPAPRPEGLPTLAERAAAAGRELPAWFTRPQPIDQRFVGDPLQVLSEGRPPHQQVWLRADGALPDDQLTHACVVAYASDMSLLNAAMLPHWGQWQGAQLMLASLDHAMWFHRPFRADRWMLYDQESPTASGARGLARGEIYTAGGTLAVSVVQEGLMRSRPGPGA